MAWVYLDLDIWKEEVPVRDEHLEFIIKQLRIRNPEFKVLSPVDGRSHDESKVGFEETLIQYSEEYPKLLFCMNVESTEGTGIETVWRHYFQNGKTCEISPVWPEFSPDMLH